MILIEGARRHRCELGKTNAKMSTLQLQRVAVATVVVVTVAVAVVGSAHVFR